MRDFLRPLVDEQQHQVRFGMMFGDGLAEVLEQRGLARLGRRDDETALAAPDGRDQIDHTQADLGLLCSKLKRLVRIDRDEVLEMGEVFGLRRVQASGFLNFY